MDINQLNIQELIEEIELLESGPEFLSIQDNLSHVFDVDDEDADDNNEQTNDNENNPSEPNPSPNLTGTLNEDNTQPKPSLNENFFEEEEYNCLLEDDCTQEDKNKTIIDDELTVQDDTLIFQNKALRLHMTKALLLQWEQDVLNQTKQHKQGEEKEVDTEDDSEEIYNLLSSSDVKVYADDNHIRLWDD